MINWLIEASLRNRLLVIAFFLLVGGWGYWALLTTTPIDAIPDLSDNQVIVFYRLARAVAPGAGARQAGGGRVGALR
jgi:Cu/Ag efflux pump CusA